jgi:hypothetical protein
VSARLLNATAAVSAVVLLVLASPRVAMAANQPPGGGGDNFGVQQGTSGTEVNGSDVTVNAGLTQGTGSGNAGATVTTTGGNKCTSQAIDGESAVNLINANSSTSITINGVPGAGTWYLITCPGTTPSLTFVGASAGQAAPPPLAQPIALAQQALATMHLPAPRLGMSPPSTAEVVNFQDWLWVDSAMWRPLSATASVGAVAATATATPDRVVYDMGDGGQVVCTGPGTPYNLAVSPDAQSTGCSYRYANSSAGQQSNRYTATATIYWHVTWTAVGAPGGGDLGEIPGDTASTQVEVDEVQALNVPTR